MDKNIRVSEWARSILMNNPELVECEGCKTIVHIDECPSKDAATCSDCVETEQAEGSTPSSTERSAV